MATQATAGDDSSLGRDRTALKDFLTQLEEFLELVIRERPELLGTHAAAIAGAWPIQAQRFAAVRAGIDSELQDEVNNVPSQLEAHGLRGDELALKLDVFAAALTDFLDELDVQDEAERYWATWATRLRGSGVVARGLRERVRHRLASLRAAGRKLLRGKFGWIVEAADVILDSLGKALAFLPGVGAAAAGIGEFKETVKVALYQPEEIDKPMSKESSQGGSYRLRSKVQADTKARRAAG